MTDKWEDLTETDKDIIAMKLMIEELTVGYQVLKDGGYIIAACVLENWIKEHELLVLKLKAGK